MRALALRLPNAVALRAKHGGLGRRSVSVIVPRMQGQGEKEGEPSNVPARRQPEAISGALSAYDPFADFGFPAVTRMSSVSLWTAVPQLAGHLGVAFRPLHHQMPPAPSSALRHPPTHPTLPPKPFPALADVVCPHPRS